MQFFLHSWRVLSLSATKSCIFGDAILLSRERIRRRKMSFNSNLWNSEDSVADSEHHFGWGNHEIFQIVKSFLCSCSRKFPKIFHREDSKIFSLEDCFLLTRPKFQWQIQHSHISHVLNFLRGGNHPSIPGYTSGRSFEDLINTFWKSQKCENNFWNI